MAEELEEVRIDQSVSENHEVEPSHCSTESSSSALEDLFADRYSLENESYAKICKGFEPVICLHPFHSRPKRNFDNNSSNQYRGRGGWNRGGGDWRGGGGRGGWRGGGRRDDYSRNGQGGGNWQNNDRRGQRRPWNDGNDRRSDGGGRRFRAD
ncbi:unnamed protein product [Cylicocyclus nassatus]|uniref:Uncharacterized protein n=1 Tax=Cylicocyclus nassatus TaxID=53992 RepID=A0AA36M132_CYLNA|nr:unnamed protein product [Cylicocyclus nassatus]